MASFQLVAAALGIFLTLLVVSSAQSNATDLDYGSGNYTGGNFTSDDIISCSELSCQGPGSSCMESNTTAATCICEDGYRLMSDRRTCESCPGGTYGYECRNNCSCGEGGNTCNKMNGTCICNTCYTGTSCETGATFDCFVQFLGNTDKSFGTLRETYGFMGYPVVPTMYHEELVTNLAGIAPIDAGIVGSVSIETISRADVNQGELIQLKYSLVKSQGPLAVNSALQTVENQVKVGTIAATLIVQDSPTSPTADVTINAGIKNNEN